MALSDSDVIRLKYHLGYNVLGIGAEPYIGIVAIFNQVVQKYMTSGASTTSSTSVVAASTPTQATVTLAAPTGFTPGDRVVVDVDSREEVARIQSVAGSNIQLLLSLAHSGTYPITVEGGETIVRDLLRKCDSLDGFNGALEGATDTAGIKKVDEIEFYGNDTSKGQKDQTAALRDQLAFWRDELASALGVQNLRRRRRGGSFFEAY